MRSPRNPIRFRDTKDRRLVWIRPTVKAAEMQRALLQTGRPVLQKVWRAVPSAQRAAIERSVHELVAAAEQVLAAQRQAAGWRQARKEAEEGQ